MPIAAIIDWYGPFDTVEAFKSELRNWDKGVRTLYMALGPYNRIRYVGLTETPFSRFDSHPKLMDSGNRRFYAGEITTQGISGRRKTKHSPDLAIAEHALIAFLDPELNSQLKGKDLQDCVCLYSRFFSTKDWETQIWPLPENKFPPIIAFSWWSGEFV